MLSDNNSMNTGIYAIEHVPSGRMYIGSSKDFSARWRTHLCLLRNGKHHSPHLQSAWNKYSEDAFSFRRILVCQVSDLIDYEQRLIDGYQSFDREYGFNARARAETNLGRKASSETREKIRIARAKQVFSDATRAIWSANRTGRKMPEGFGDRARVWKTGNKHTAATKAHISAIQVGNKQHLKTVERRSKLTLDQVEAIKLRAALGETQTQLATEFSLSQSSISLIVRGKRWANFTNQLT